MDELSCRHREARDMEPNLTCRGVWGNRNPTASIDQNGTHSGTMVDTCSLFAHTFPELRAAQCQSSVGKYGRLFSELFGLEKYGTFAAHLKLGRQSRNSLYVP